MKRLVRAGSAYLWSLTIRECMGIGLLALLIGTAIAAMTWTVLGLIQTLGQTFYL